MKTKNKKFDAVAMKRTGALRIYRRVKNMTFEERVAYWRDRSEAFHREQERKVPAALGRRLRSRKK